MVWIPHTDILNIEDFCPSQFYFVMAVHAFTIFIAVCIGFRMGYHATSKILNESWEMYAIFHTTFRFFHHMIHIAAFLNFTGYQYSNSTFIYHTSHSML